MNLLAQRDALRGGPLAPTVSISHEHFSFPHVWSCRQEDRFLRRQLRWWFRPMEYKVPTHIIGGRWSSKWEKRRRSQILRTAINGSRMKISRIWKGRDQKNRKTPNCARNSIINAKKHEIIRIAKQTERKEKARIGTSKTARDNLEAPRRRTSRREEVERIETNPRRKRMPRRTMTKDGGREDSKKTHWRREREADTQRRTT